MTLAVSSSGKWSSSSPSTSWYAFLHSLAHVANLPCAPAQRYPPPRCVQLIGSDAPHLIPFTMPKPYPRDNEPAYLPHVLVTLAECLGLSLHEVARATTANARRAFGLPTLPYDGSLRTPLPELTRYTPPPRRAVRARAVACVRTVGGACRADEKQTTRVCPPAGRPT
jgi:hypothetical protein